MKRIWKLSWDNVAELRNLEECKTEKEVEENEEEEKEKEWRNEGMKERVVIIKDIKAAERKTMFVK